MWNLEIRIDLIQHAGELRSKRFGALAGLDQIIATGLDLDVAARLIRHRGGL